MTVAEDWHAKKELQDAYVQQFIDAKPGDVDASESVLMARLSGLGLRGDYLMAEWRQATVRRFDRLQAIGNCDECNGSLDKEGHCPDCDYGFDEGEPQKGFIPPKT